MIRQFLIKSISRFFTILIVTLIVKSIFRIGKLDSLFGVDPTYVQWLSMIAIVTLVISPLEKNDREGD